MTSQLGVAELTTEDRNYIEASRFLFREAELLDANRFDEWLACLDPDLRYLMPVRTTMLREDLDATISRSYGHFDDTYDSILYRVKRVQLPSAISEDPPSRTRRFVTNIRVHSDSKAADQLHVNSYLLVLRSRWSDPDFEIISAERQDILRRNNDVLRLLAREIIVDQATLGTVNLGLFL